jgi:hypothetical protein
VGMTPMENKCLHALDEDSYGKRPLSRPKHRKKGNVKVDHISMIRRS